MTTDPFIEGVRRILEARPDLTASGVSVRAGLDNSTVRKLMSGANSSPRIDTAMKIAAAMGYELSDVIAIGEHEDGPSVLALSRSIAELPATARAEVLSYLSFVGERHRHSEDAESSKPELDRGSRRARQEK